MIKKIFFSAVCAFLVPAVFDEAKRPAPVRLTSSHMAVDNVTGAVLVSGDTSITTCTNDPSCLHWKMTGEGSGQRDKYVALKDMWTYLYGIPVVWMPYWYYPMDTEYGWRMMPGYSSKWGAFLLTKYVYPIAGGSDPEGYGLKGASRFDLRTKNGLAVGQSARWHLGDFGKGLFKVYYAWDLDADRYERHWNNPSKWHYRNWGSTVPDERYVLNLEHDLDLTERDAVRLRGAIFSDSYFNLDFLRDSLFGVRNRMDSNFGNELAWEHNESVFGFGASVTGPLNDFYGGVSRLPEFYFDVSPMPVPWLPLNYESASKIGYLNRNYAKLGDRNTAAAYRTNPGKWADYNTFRMDSYHRLTAPMKWWDTVAAVPRFGARGTYWGDSGYESLTGNSRAGRTGNDVWRSVVEGGVTFSGRGEAALNDSWSHIVEPYLDVLCQEADYSGLERGSRPYVFDSADASMDWLDQFAGRSRNLPYSWYGITPGWRNVWKKADERGDLKTVFDLDVYAAVQFNDTRFTDGAVTHRLAEDPADPNYGEDMQVVPGVRAGWNPGNEASLLVRAEYDTENDELAYANLQWKHKIRKDFSYSARCDVRNYRWWDFSSTPYSSANVKKDRLNWIDDRTLTVGGEHEIFEFFAWGPYITWDVDKGELDEIGSWFDYRTDCLGFRFLVSYEHEYERVDGSKWDDNWRFGFFIYLRTFGPDKGSPLGD
jgi:hypothetical protein